ncbi:ubiquitin fusion degradation protein [Sporothrix brasiliensis 5110]|uniref:Ubiquitin fusion degradation protein n=1 Tax=Sporothrix brasiliensis 5110 TaxID=1398154 RepID=A0A0C2EWT3_9PEZI|nr:ubiquitin fusion degradation protein [Sporothrix brasiliensis 5110]KIH91029.1 ubiquitin fusion degradation protein [Sporothrix brasiliensis 5110]
MATLHADSNEGADSLSNTNINTNSGFDVSPVFAEEQPIFQFAQLTLLQLLTNSLVLAHTAPYLSAHDVLRLAATNRDFRALLYDTPSLFRYLDLSRLQSAVRLGRDHGEALLEPIDRGGQTWRHEQIDENLTEDEFYSGPLRGAFRALSRPGIHTGLSTSTLTQRGTWLSGVHTLILNNVSVTAELVHEILRSPEYNVRILSLRNAKHCNEVQLRHILRTACRASRPVGTPKLRGLYIFSSGRRGDSSWDSVLGGYRNTASSSSSGPHGEKSDESDDPHPNGDDLWYRGRGRVLPRMLTSAEWAGTLLECRGVLAFDGVLCTAPRHTNSLAFGRVPSSASTSRPHLAFAMASFSLDGCASCGSAPDGWTTWGDPAFANTQSRGGGSGGGDDEGDPYLSRFPLLWPPPLLSSNVRVAMCPEGESVHPHRFAHHRGETPNHAHQDPTTSTTGSSPARFIPRCESCVYGRLCALCHRWWCEACMPDGENGRLIDYSCRECGPSCHDCVSKIQRQCKRCRQSYCMLHNTGSSPTHNPRLVLKSHY